MCFQAVFCMIDKKEKGEQTWKKCSLFVQNADVMNLCRISSKPLAAPWRSYLISKTKNLLPSAVKNADIQKFIGQKHLQEQIFWISLSEAEKLCKNNKNSVAVKPHCSYFCTEKKSRPWKNHEKMEREWKKGDGFAVFYQVKVKSLQNEKHICII